MIASDPYIIEYGVSPVHLFGVVQYAHRTWGNSSTHLPFALSNLFFNSLTINLLVASACPLLCGLVSLDYLFLIPNSQQYLRKALLLNWRPLSKMRVCGMPNLVTIFHQKNFVLVSNIGEGFHFDPFGEIISFGKKPYMIPSCFENGLTMSNPHCAKGHGLERRLRVPPGWWIFGAYRWHWLHFLANS